MSSVPNNKFPFITCYSRKIDRIKMEPITDYEDCLNIDYELDFGKISSQKGLSNILIEFAIYNNEPSVSAGMTKFKFNDAELCNIEFENISMSNIEVLNEAYIKQDNNDIILSSYVTKLPVLSGCGDSINFTIGIKQLGIEKIMNNGVYNFKVVFSYMSDRILVKIPFNCKIEFVNNSLNGCNIGEFKNNNNVFSGKVYGNHIPAIITAVDRKLNKKYDETIFNDENYNLFIGSGKYDLIFENNLLKRVMKDVVVHDNLELNYKYVIDGLITEINKDIVIYNDEKDVKLIYGKLLDNRGNPVSNAEIILSKDDEIVIYCKTSIDGRYSFVLDYGIYDIRIRSNSCDVKILRDFEFKDIDEGFFYKVKEINKTFKKDFIFNCNY